jgi:hypothetical protein
LCFEAVLQKEYILGLLPQRNVILRLQMLLQLTKRKTRKAIVEEYILKLFSKECKCSSECLNQILESTVRVVKEACLGDFIS